MLQKFHSFRWMVFFNFPNICIAYIYLQVLTNQTISLKNKISLTLIATFHSFLYFSFLFFQTNFMSFQVKKQTNCYTRNIMYKRVFLFIVEFSIKPITMLWAYKIVEYCENYITVYRLPFSDSQIFCHRFGKTIIYYFIYSNLPN